MSLGKNNLTKTLNFSGDRGTERLMIDKLNKLAVILAFLLLSNNVFAETLTHKKIRHMVKALDKKIIEKDIDGMAAYFSSDLTVELKAFINGQDIFFHINNKKEYIQSYRDMIDGGKEHKYSRDTMQIKIRNEGKSAFVKGKIRETLYVNQKESPDKAKYDAIKMEEFIIEWKNGKPVITQYSSWFSI